MPGPRNAKKKKQTEAQKAKRAKGQQPVHVPDGLTLSPALAALSSVVPNVLYDEYNSSQSVELRDDTVPHSLRTPFVEDPGNGPRVRDMRAFLASSFATRPPLDDPLCAEFAQEEVREMLCSILPEETALILWYNKSRKSARVCPACQRLYCLGDTLPDHLDQAEQEQPSLPEQPPSPYLLREQELSGLCSPVCFILAAYNYPSAIKSTWGRVAEELDDETWRLLDGPGTQQNDIGLGMLVKMTRCHDLGLGQLLFPDMDMDSDETCGDGDGGWENPGGQEKTDAVIPSDTVTTATAEMTA
ncbi:hypothetical protein OBBRIDRAFT_795199 [Obba rivulosa]|uniref:Uncharacterized protein n=1 Tax=Obba rivulosa TaxID=1052685 RepID=A0A8E2DK50_9APHY|nr:hypothetical protein OBBRIDRAFT_795199 [Obba rivulosa]